MELEIRFSQECDFNQLVELDHRIWSATTTPATIHWKSVSEFSIRNPAGSQVVALVDGEVVGYLGFHASTPLETNQHVMELDIGVDEAFQGMGIGKSLLAKAKEVAIDRGVHKLSIRVLATNEGAIQFYRHVGFIDQGRLIDEFFINGRYVDDLLMYLLLK